MVVAPGCGLCHVDPANVLVRVTRAVLLLPNAPHISVRDGGHLLVTTVRHVESRVDYSDEEAREVHQLTVLAARALRDLTWADWINFQENGNWSVDAPAGPHSHTHVYGRSRQSTNQPFGEPLRLPTSAELLAMPVPAVSALEIAGLRRAVATT